jgi:hypothetical protein
LANVLTNWLARTRGSFENRINLKQHVEQHVEHVEHLEQHVDVSRYSNLQTNLKRQNLERQNGFLIYDVKSVWNQILASMDQDYGIKE